MKTVWMALPPARRRRLRLEAWLFARLLPLRLGHDLSAALALAEAAPGRHLCAPPEAIAHLVGRVTRRPVLMRRRRCLRAGLTGFRMLRRAGHDPALHFALVPDSLGADRINAHCWVTLAGRPVIGDRTPEMVELFVHRGAVAPAADAA